MPHNTNYSLLQIIHCISISHSECLNYSLLQAYTIQMQEKELKEQIFDIENRVYPKSVGRKRVVKYKQAN